VYHGISLGSDIKQLGQDDPWDRMEHIGVEIGGGEVGAGKVRLCHPRTVSPTNDAHS